MYLPTSSLPVSAWSWGTVAADCTLHSIAVVRELCETGRSANVGAQMRMHTDEHVVEPLPAAHAGGYTQVATQERALTSQNMMLRRQVTEVYTCCKLWSQESAYHVPAYLPATKNLNWPSGRLCVRWTERTAQKQFGCHRENVGKPIEEISPGP